MVKGNQRFDFILIQINTPPLGKKEIDDNDHEECSHVLDKLKMDIFTAAHDVGTVLISNGSVNNVKTSKKIRCGSAHRQVRETTSTSTTNFDGLRKVSLVNNAKHTRKLGRGAPNTPRKTTSKDHGHSCKFGFIIKCDRYGYFVTLQYNGGNPTHTGHPRCLNPSLTPYPKRLMTEEMIRAAKQAMDAQSSKAAGRNFIFGQFGKYIGTMKIAYLSSRNDDGSRKKEDDISRMLETFQSSDEVRFTTLSDMPVQDYLEFYSTETHCDKNITRTVSVTKNGPNDKCVENVADNPSLAEIETIAQNERVLRKMQPKDVLFISVAWTVLPVFRLFLLCPEVIWCDVTSHSNNKGFHLLTFSCRVSINKQVVFLWIWIPNQQRFSFRWVFQHALNTLIPKIHRDRVRFIMKDGDNQQRNEVLMALKQFFPNASEGGCGYHIVHNTWYKYVPKVTTLLMRYHDNFKKITSHILRWVYSWMQPSFVENSEEYKISKFLLIQFISSRSVLMALGGKEDLVKSILRWLRGHVLVWEDSYLFFLRKKCRNYLTAHSSAHEVR